MNKKALNKTNIKRFPSQEKRKSRAMMTLLLDLTNDQRFL
jgi:hypothetical protein